MVINESSDYMDFIASNNRHLRVKLVEADNHISELYAQIETLEDKMFKHPVSDFLSHVKLTKTRNIGRDILYIEIDAFNSIQELELVSHLNKYLDRVVFPKLRERIIKALVKKE